MEIFKQLKKLGYKHYIDLTIDELDALSNDSIEKRIEYSLVIDWFREKHKINIFGHSMTNSTNFRFVLDRLDQPIKHDIFFTSTYYTAREQAILKCIELLKNK